MTQQKHFKQALVFGNKNKSLAHPRSGLTGDGARDYRGVLPDSVRPAGRINRKALVSSCSETRHGGATPIPETLFRGWVPSASKNRGAAALVTVVIVVVATLIMAVAASRLGLGELERGVTASSGGEAFAVADGCMEETLRRIRIDTNYGVGSSTISLTTDNGSCTIDITASGSNRRITVKGTHDVYHARIRSQISLSGNVISVTSWEERDD